eukprot:1158030-Pelagomonas_calceolata.AAC.6
MPQGNTAALHTIGFTPPRIIHVLLKWQKRDPSKREDFLTHQRLPPSASSMSSSVGGSSEERSREYMDMTKPEEMTNKMMA